MVPIPLDRELLERLEIGEQEKIVDCTRTHECWCVRMSVHESILHFSYSCVALIKVMFLCGYPQLLKILCLERWNDGTCLFFYFLIFCALCINK